ncbi:glycogen synthase [Clostridium perfringens]|uniref:Glycogen synthase n=1 Tax=Clostridium perfringens TaxID=1502 RepID=A0A2X2YHE4_CLOPF|nr:glycogen synthase GlgA [Clostridium perfringens]PWX22338.1 glycogen synthase GlgA [Clostridium perfringens]SQB59945.1 glycogen synthase [Clostridium perfringens]
MIKVLFATSEANPFIKTGGLGDVMGALPKELKRKGIDARVILPKYSAIKGELLEKLSFKKWFMVPVGWRNQYCGVYQCEYDEVIYYLLDSEFYFHRNSLYGEGDDGERFAFFDRAVLETLKEIDWCPDIIHCNDWQTGMIPVLHKLEYSKDPFYKDIKTVTSIHNLLFQGNFSADILPELFGYDYEPVRNGSLEFYGGMSFMKGAINYSDRILTVSETYAKEIQTPYFGENLDGLLRERGYALKGIVNGIDYDEFNPSKDSLIAKNFSVETIEDKVLNKLALQKELGLPINPDIPMISIVSRLTNQKGCDLIVNIANRLLQRNVQLVILGTGDYNYENHFKGLQELYPTKVSANIKFDNRLAHRIYASSDIFLMPSLFEPCGLGQLIALRYGAIPIVRETGGLKDTIHSYNKYTGIGNGFSFTNYNHNDLMYVIELALETYDDKEIWRSLIIQAMDSDNSWNKSAEKYKELYEELIK